MTIQSLILKGRHIMTTTYENYILDAVVEQVRLKSNINYGVRLTEPAKAAIKEFLYEQDLNGSGINVVFAPTIPEEYTETTIINNGDHDLAVAFGKNNRKGKYPNVLFCSISKTQKAKFRGFWVNRELPLELLEEAVEKLDLTRPVEIDTYTSPREWNLMRKSDSTRENLEFIGQTPHKKSGSFQPTLPIGYVTQSNKLVITTPNQNFTKKRTQYIFS